MEEILEQIKYWNEFFPEDIVAIGGIAVYLHAYDNVKKNKNNNLYDYNDGELILEGTHDGDFYITQNIMFEFKELESNIVMNKRLRKHELKKNNTSYDIYKEYENDLCIDNQELQNNSIVIDNIRVASLEHLLALKLKAAMDPTRTTSKKGEKDFRDIIKIVFLNPDLTNKNNFSSEELDFVKQAIQKNNSYQIIAQGNNFYANKIKNKTKTNFEIFESKFKNKKSLENKLK